MSAKIKQEILTHKKTILDNNEFILEIIMESTKLGAKSNTMAIELMRNQNRILKRIIKELSDKLKG